MTLHVDVLIATPGRNMEAEYVKSLVTTISYLNDQDITYLFMNKYSSMVSSAREATAMNDMFLDPFNNKPARGKVSYDKIFWIDSDIEWEITDFTRILESSKDIVSGVYFNELMSPMFSVDSEKPKEEILRILESNKEEEVFAVGFGFIAMKQGVFESIPRPWFDTTFQEYKSPENGKVVMIPLGEDYSWCSKAKKEDYKIYVNPTVRLSHHKKTKIKLDRK